MAVCWVEVATELVEVEVEVKVDATDTDVCNAFWVDVEEIITTAEVEEAEDDTGLAGKLDVAGFGRFVGEVEEEWEEFEI